MIMGYLIITQEPDITQLWNNQREHLYQWMKNYENRWRDYSCCRWK